jgi:hypothetical protein
MLTDHEPDPGRWLRDSITSFGSQVSDLVPDFPAYRRVFHRPDDGRTWRTVAQSNGKRSHPLMQWESIAKHGDPAPRVGELDAGTWSALVKHFATPGVWCATWTGWGGTPVAAEYALLQLPQREYRLNHGEVGRARIDQSGQPASYIWPADHSWIVATGIDYDSTIVGGDPQLLSRVGADSRIETASVNGSESLAIDADVLNR